MSVKIADVTLVIVKRTILVFALSVTLFLALVMIIFECLKNYISNLKDRLLKKA